MREICREGETDRERVCVGWVREREKKRGPWGECGEEARHMCGGARYGKLNHEEIGEREGESWG